MAEMSLSRAGLLLLLISLLTLPFLDKPVHIDDTVVLHISRTILETPLHPLAGEIDWFGHVMPVFETTTNPPFLSYWLAPWLAWGKGSEIVLHLAMLPFFFLFGGSVFFLARRFGAAPWIVTAAVVTSVPFVVSGNLMRDIPAAALGTAGMTLALRGLDRGDRRHVVGGGVLLGCAILTKYSIAVLIGPLALYILAKKQYRWMAGLLIPLAILGFWCVQTAFFHGQAHPLYLLLERTSSDILWQDKFLSGLTILGTSLLLVPWICAVVWRKREWGLSAGALLLVLGANSWGYWFYDSFFDVEFSLWLTLGTLLVTCIVQEVMDGRRDPDRLFLGAWFFATFGFSFLFVPFQAVRHLIPLLAPAAILVVLFLQRRGGIRSRAFVTGLLLIQAFLALGVQSADYEYAATYRDFAREKAASAGDRDIWFVGHWGWKFYARRHGFEMLHREGRTPKPGDLILWPRKVHIGDVFSEREALRERMELLETRRYEGVLPLRTMGVDVEAGFYAVIRRRLPFRWNPSSPLEEMRTYIVQPDF